MKYIFKTLCCAVVSFLCMNVYAVDVTVAPGQLRGAVGADAATAVTLSVTGAVNAADLEFVRYDMPALRSLDLSNATIASYSGAKLVNGRYGSPANCFPEFALLGSEIATVKLPANLTAIADGAFAASKVSSIEIPASVTTIGVSAFADCGQLAKIVIPESVTAIGQGAFSNCTSLTRADVNGPLTEIPARAFAGCTSLALVVLPATVETVGEEAFALTGLEKIALSRCTALKSVGKWAFAGCEKLEAVWMPSPVPVLAEGAFFHNVGLAADVTALQGKNPEIADYAYTGNSRMTVDAFDGSKVENIGNYSLSGIDGVSELAMPATLRKLGDHAMAGWTGLTIIKGAQLASVPDLGDDVWEGVDQHRVTLEVASAVADAFRAAPQWQDFVIREVQTTLEEVVDAGEAAGLTGHFSGQLLHLESTAGKILGIQLYDMGGRMYALPSATPDYTLTIDASSIDNGVYIVRALLDDNRVGVLKLNK